MYRINDLQWVMLMRCDSYSNWSLIASVNANTRWSRCLAENDNAPVGTIKIIEKSFLWFHHCTQTCHGQVHSVQISEAKKKKSFWISSCFRVTVCVFSSKPSPGCPLLWLTKFLRWLASFLIFYSNCLLNPNRTEPNRTNVSFTKKAQIFLLLVCVVYKSMFLTRLICI